MNSSPLVRSTLPVPETVVRVSAPAVGDGVPMGLGSSTPSLSWQVHAPTGRSVQRAEVEVAGEDRGTVRVRCGPDQVLVRWPVPPLRSRERVTVRVRVEVDGRWSPFGPPTAVETGLLRPEDWSARYISPRTLGGLTDGAPVLATDVELTERPVRARLYVTARGLCQLALDGRVVGDALLTPGWTAYAHRLRYRSYDVTSMVHPGTVRLSAVLGNGWYRGQLVWPGNRSSYGDRLALLAQLELLHADGTVQRVVTDDSWRAGPTGILADDLYDGEVRDLRRPLHPDGVLTGPVDVLAGDDVALVAPSAPPVRITQTVPALSISTSPSGATLVDFGQNLVGWVRLRVRDARPGAEVVVRHAEVLEHGELGTRPLRSAEATCRYLLCGDDEEVLEPTLTFHGFRYAEVVGLPGLGQEDVEAVVVGSDLRRTGWFSCSDPDLDRLHRNVVWSTRGNFLDLPTDCPQRDERLGWTGDIAAFAPTANFLFDTRGFLGGWLADLAVEQRPDGGVPNVVPDVLREPDAGVAGWGDAATVVPTSLWWAFGDRDVLGRQYPSMRAWVEKVRRRAPTGLWDTGEQLGDWLDPTAPPDDPQRAQADPSVVATAWFARSAELLASAARELGYPADAERYTGLREEVVQAYNRAYVDDDGRIRSDCQTVYAQAVVWRLLPDARRRAGAGERLAELVRAAGHRVSTGFVGTPLVLDALTLAGRVDLACSMLLNREPPSWLYAVTMGGTTVWERWDSMLPDGSINPGTMTSFNHYAYGAVADWMHRAIGGLTALEPGYRRIRVAPLAVQQLDHAELRLDCPYGTIEVRWWRAEQFELELQVPTGVTAQVQLPGWSLARTVTAGRHHFSGPAPT